METRTSQPPMLAADGNTLLSYAMFTSPDPLQVSATNAVLTLVVSNDLRQFVTVENIVVTLPVGTNAKDLTADATGVETELPEGWEANRDGGSITLTPSDDAAKIGGSGLTFVFSTSARIRTRRAGRRLDHPHLERHAGDVHPAGSAGR